MLELAVASKKTFRHMPPDVNAKVFKMLVANESEDYTDVLLESIVEVEAANNGLASFFSLVALA